VNFAGWALAAFAALLPFQALGPWSVSAVARFELGDWILALASPWLAALLWRQRTDVFSSPIVRAWIVFSVAGAISIAIHGIAGAELARVVAPSVVVASLVALREDESARVLLAAVRGGWIALGLGLIGYAFVAVGLIPPVDGDLLFAFRSPHPVFDGVLRLSGTFGHACQELGDYALVWLACLGIANVSQRERIAGFAIGSLATLLTFSSAWVGLPCVAMTYFERTRRFAWLAIAASLALSAISSYRMNFEPPNHRAYDATTQLEADCDRLDIEHYVTQLLDDGTCRQLVQRWPAPARLTTYWHAKQVAWNAFVIAPLFGIGSGQFRTAANSSIATRFDEDAAASFYQSPHSQYLGTLAERGILGAVALIALLWTLFRAAPGPLAADTLRAALLGLALIGLNADLFHARYVWLLAGLLAATEARRSRRA
jgi:hypothetical protein